MSKLPDNEAKSLWTAQDVADLLARSTKWVYRMAAQRRIPHIKVSRGTVRFDPVDIAEWVRTKKARAAQAEDRILSTRISAAPTSGKAAGKDSRKETSKR